MKYLPTILTISFLLGIIAFLCFYYIPQVKELRETRTYAMGVDQMNILEMKKQWVENLGLQNWNIYLIFEPDVNKMNKPDTPKGYYVAGDTSTFEGKNGYKIAFIRINHLTEKVLVHELTHVAYPDATEMQVRALTEQELHEFSH